MSYVDDFIHKLNQTAPEVKSFLKQIRNVDFQAEKLQVKVENQRQKFLITLKNSQLKRQSSNKKQFDKKYREIIKSQKMLLQYSKQKVQLAEQLYNFIHEPTQKLDKQLIARGQKFAKIGTEVKGKKGKRKGRPSKQEWENDPNQPKYCYCGKPSYGQMVMCQNTYCEKQWFHRLCIDQKKLPDKWYCKDCRQNR